MAGFGKIHRAFYKIGHFEFWPFWLFYMPMYFYGLILAIRSGSFTYFTAANPVMKYGGAFGTSKYDVLQRINPALVPGGIRIRSKEANAVSEADNRQEECLNEAMEGGGLEFPVIAKPDIGERGRGVELIESMEDLVEYLENHSGLIILQEYISLPLELGILYHRTMGGYPGDISSVVIRDFLSVQGDGNKTIFELINEKMRAASRRKYLYRKFEDRLEDIPRKGKIILLEPIGNHVRGTRFLNGNHLINDDLKKLIYNIANSIEGFDYGRFDLKVENLENLYQGKGIKILELNGVNSEPAHIYDPEYRIIQAYRDIAYHMKIIFQISKYNHRNGTPHVTLVKFLKDFISQYFRPGNSDLGK